MRDSWYKGDFTNQNRILNALPYSRVIGSVSYDGTSVFRETVHSTKDREPATAGAWTISRATPAHRAFRARADT